MSDTTPDTTALRALADFSPRVDVIGVRPADIRALCDGYDEAQRLRQLVDAKQAWIDGAKVDADQPCDHSEWHRDMALIVSQKQALDLALDRNEALIRERDAARQALAALIGELRGLCDEYTRDRHGMVPGSTLLAVIDPYDPGAS